MAEEQEAPKKRSAVKIMVGVALLLVIAGTGVWYFTARKAGAQEKGSKPERPQIKAVMHLEGFVVNLADPEERAFLRAGIDIGLDKEPGGGGGHGAKPTLPTAQIRDAILSVLSTWKAADLLTPEGKTKLKEQLVQALGKSAPELGVREVYFTDFLVQR